MAGDLDGLLVVSIEQAVAAPYVSGKLAEAGARVIKVERNEGDFAREYDHLVHGESAYFVWLNRGKESVCLDLRTEDDRSVLDAMLESADVFIQNLAPGAIERLGYGHDTLRKANPRLITVSISGYGDEGPYSGLKAYDLLVQAATGVGRHISVSLFHALTDWMNVPYLQFVYGGKEPARNGLSHPTIAPYGAFAGSDEKLVLLSIQNEREWVKFCEGVLHHPEIATDPRFDSNSKRVENRADLDRIIQEVFATRTRDDLSTLLHDAGIANGRVSTMEDLSQHPQNRYVEVETPTGPVRMLSPGALVNGQVPNLGAVPALGAHSEAGRQEFKKSTAASS